MIAILEVHAWPSLVPSFFGFIKNISQKQYFYCFDKVEKLNNLKNCCKISAIEL